MTNKSNAQSVSDLRQAMRRQLGVHAVQNVRQLFEPAEKLLREVEKSLEAEDLSPAGKVELEALRDSLRANPDRGRFVLGRNNDDGVAGKGKLVVTESFEFEADGLVVDQQLGTLGILQFCTSHGNDAAEQALSAEIERYVQEAVYVRHLLLAEEEEKTNRRPYFVELVLIIPSPGPHTRQWISQTLRQMMQRTGCFHVIGINVLCDEALLDSAQAKADLPRAFCWLMTNVRKWLEAQPKKTSAHGALNSVTLTDMRLEGERNWQLLDTPGLHLVHGHNGTGKSSLSEAIELVMMGSIERLEQRGIRDYGKVLTNDRVHSPDEPDQRVARIKLEATYGPVTERATSHDATLPNTVVEVVAVRSRESPVTYDKRPVQPTFPVPLLQDPGSFRLNESISEDLSRGTPARRAERFLSAFFPGKKIAIDEARQARQKLDQAWGQIKGNAPEGLSPDGVSPPTPERIQNELAWMQEDEFRIEELLRFTPVPSIRKALAGGGRFAGKALFALIDENLSVIDEERSRRLEQLDRAWQRTRTLAADDLSDLIELESHVKTLDQWQAGSGRVAGTTEEVAQALNQWLEEVVRFDLGSREAQILGTLSDAQDKQPQLAFLSHHRDQEQWHELLASLREELPKIETLRNELGERVRAMVTVVDRPVAEAGAKPAFSQHALSLFERFFPLADKKLSLPTMITAALNDDRSKSVQIEGGPRITIGEQGGCTQLTKYLDKLKADVSAIVGATSAWQSSFVGTYNSLSLLQQTSLGQHLAGEKVLDEFRKMLGKDGNLANAINELMAVLTPARWAYGNLLPSQTYDGAEGRLDFLTPDEVAAALRLNTAELNTFTLTLFMLCAVGIDNPIKTLVLDDPFQNMDELTITTIARGLGRLLAMWEKGLGLEEWRLVILLHGEENVERFRREIPCAAYFLPWLSIPNRAGGGQTVACRLIESERSLLSTQLQEIQGLIKEDTTAVPV